MKTIHDIRIYSIHLLSSANIDSPELVVDILLTFLLKYSSLHHMRADASLPFPHQHYAVFFSFLERVLHDEPIAYIIGKKYFLDFEFIVSPATLIPRPETEELVELILDDIDISNSTLLDIGTGSGCIACSLALYHPNIHIVAIDSSYEALLIAYRNVLSYDISSVHLIQADLYALPFSPSSFTHIIANPPYLSEEEYQYLHKNVRDFEPYHALVSGKTGIEAIQQIITASYLLLKDGGALYLEIGHLQRKEIEKHIMKMNWKSYTCKQDLSHKERFFILKR